MSTIQERPLGLAGSLSGGNGFAAAGAAILRALLAGGRAGVEGLPYGWPLRRMHLHVFVDRLIERGPTPRDVVMGLEAAPALPGGAGERFAGYGVTGVTFASGHLLALHRFPASSIRPAYTSVWHRGLEGQWTFYSDVEPGLACGRYFGAAGTRAVHEEIAISWTAERTLSVRLRSLGLAWVVHLGQTRITRLLNSVAPRLPSTICRIPGMRRALSAVAGRALGIGRLALGGHAPRGQRFSLEPRQLWMVDATVARSAIPVAGRGDGRRGHAPARGSRPARRPASARRFPRWPAAGAAEQPRDRAEDRPAHAGRGRRLRPRQGGRWPGRPRRRRLRRLRGAPNAAHRARGARWPGGTKQAD